MDMNDQVLTGLLAAILEQQEVAKVAVDGIVQERIRLADTIDAFKNASNSLQAATETAASNAVTQTLNKIPDAATKALDETTKVLDDATKKVFDAGAWISWKFALVFAFAGIAAVATNYLIGRFALPNSAQVEAARVELATLKSEKVELEENIALLAKRGGRIKLSTCGGRTCIEASRNQGTDTVGNPVAMGSWHTTDGRNVALIIPRGY